MAGDRREEHRREVYGQVCGYDRVYVHRGDKTMLIRISLALLISAWPAFAQSPQPSPVSGETKTQQIETPNAKQSTIDQRGTDQSPVVVRVVPVQKTPADITEEKSEREQKGELDAKLVQYNGDLAFYTESLAAIAVLQFVALCIQAYWLARTVKVSERAAKVAEDSSQAVVSQLRAYISMLKPTISGAMDDAPIRSEIFAKNTGHTPAYHFGWVSGITIKDLPFDEELRVNMDNSQISDITIGPGTEIGHTAPSPGKVRILTTEEREAIRDGKKAIFIYGEMRYVDTFKQPHTVRYQMIVGSDGRIFIHPKGNYSD
jgi:hypothetical protein